MGDQRIEIRTDLLYQLQRWASTDASRPALCSLAFVDDRVMATDGHRLVIYRTPTHGMSFIVDRRFVLAAIFAQDALARETDIEHQIGHDVYAGPDGETALFSSGQRGSRTIFVGATATHAALGIGDLVIQVPLGDVSKYPDMSQVVPPIKTSGAPGEIVFNPGYLYAMEEVIRAAGGWRDGVSCVGWGDAKSPMRFESLHGLTFVVMPMKGWRKEKAARAAERHERRAVKEMEAASAALAATVTEDTP